MLNFPIRPDRLAVSVLTATLCWGFMETVRAGAPAQTPLLSSSGAVAPNVVFTLDDSGSMLSAIMPELYTYGIAIQSQGSFNFRASNAPGEEAQSSTMCINSAGNTRRVTGSATCS